jgi:hypothetical protein
MGFASLNPSYGPAFAAHAAAGSAASGGHGTHFEMDAGLVLQRDDHAE